MEQYKQEFIEFMVESDVLKVAEFTLKSGCVWESIMPERFMRPMGMILMCCLDRHTREFRSAL